MGQFQQLVGGFRYRLTKSLAPQSGQRNFLKEKGLKAGCNSEGTRKLIFYETTLPNLGFRLG